MIGRRELPRGAILLLLGLVLLSTSRSLGNGFAFDDVPIVLENAQIHAVSPPWVYAQQSYWPPDNLGDAYRPWTIWWLALQWGLSGGTPWVFHLFNLLLTMALVVLVFRLAAELMAPAGAVAAAALFAVHPVHVEATANVVGQGELWMALFSVTAAVCYLRARRRGTLGGPTRLLLALLLVLASASKEQGIVLPGLLLLVEWLGVEPRPGENRIKSLAPTFLLLGVVEIGFLAARFAVLGDLGGGPAAAGLEGLGIGGRAMVMVPLVPEWLRLLTWPRALLSQYSPPADGANASAIAVMLGLATLGGLGALCWWSWRRLPALALGIVWTALAILPVSNVLFPTGVLVAERTLLLPSVGIVIAAGALSARFGGVGNRRVVAAVGLLVLVTLGAARSFSRQAVWRDNLTLFGQTIIDEPRSYRGYFVYGRELVRQGQTDLAETMYRHAASLFDRDQRVFEEWGQILRTKGRCDEAVAIFERGVAAQPDATISRSRLIECLIALGRYPEAAAAAKAGLDRGSEEFKTSYDRARRLEQERAAPTPPR